MFRPKRTESDSQEPGRQAHGRRPAREASSVSAYVAALTMLSRRELSEKQVRERLSRRGYGAEEIDTAVARLKEGRSLDDVRVAEAIARTQTSLRRRGKLRVRREIEQAGIAGSTAQAAVNAVFGDLDQDALLESALDRRLRGNRLISDQREFQRLYRYLITQGFESDRALKALKERQTK